MPNTLSIGCACVDSVIASYDVNKDGVKVAVLTFPKSAYRLGETILGVVELNDRPNRARVLKVCTLCFCPNVRND